jgi:hypothetical protein
LHGVKKLLAYLFLFIHMNTSMFFPVVEERDVYNSHGVQQDDINSVLELVFKIGKPASDNQSTDEDDDQPDYFQLVKTTVFTLSKDVETLPSFYPAEQSQYQPFAMPQFTFPSQEVTTPPPDRFFPSQS